MATCLLLGGNGFIGRNLAIALAQAGHSVLSADLSHTAISHEFIISSCGDLSNPDYIDNCLKQGPFDYVFLLACTLIPSSGKEAYFLELDFQKKLGCELLERMHKFGSKTLVLFSSGGAIYGNNGLAINHENAPLSPINYYGKAKKILESIIQSGAPEWGINYLILRPSNPYGIGQKLNAAQGLIAVALGKILRGEPIEIWGDGEVVRDYLHISDLISAVLALLNHDTRNEVYNIGSGDGKSVNQILEVIQSSLDYKLDIRYGESRTVDVKSSVLDIGKIKAAINWSPKVTLELGISELWQQIKQMH